MRDGKGVKKPYGPTSKLKALKKSYIKQRTYMRLHPETSAATSNLTKTGKMLDSLFYKLNKSSLVVRVRGRANETKAYWTNVFRPWINISKDEAIAIKKIVSDSLKK